MVTPFNYVEIDLDRPRKLRFRPRDVQDICRRLDKVTTLGLLQRLAEFDLEAISACLIVGLSHEDRGIRTRIDELIEAHVEKHGDMTEILAAINDALEQSGVIRSRARPMGEG